MAQARNDSLLDKTTAALKAKGLVAPLIHLNGTGGDDLFRQYAKAAEMLREAMEALPVPHGRDYYPIPGSYEIARDQRERQTRVLMGVLDELHILVGDLAVKCDLSKNR